MIAEKLNLRKKYATNFYSKDGLTSTSANHIANVAKELYNEFENKVNNIRFLNVNFEQSNSDKVIQIQKSSSKEEILNIKNNLQKIGELKGLIAYLREALNDKKVAESYYQNYTNDDFRVDLEKSDKIDLYPYFAMNRQERFGFGFYKDEPNKNFNHNLVKEDIDKVAKYLINEAHAATIGSYIHQDETLHKLRNEYNEKLVNPIETEKVADLLHVKTYSSELESEVVNGVYFELQKIHREKQKNVNSIKYEIDEKVNAISLEVDEANREIDERYATEKEKVSADVKTYKKEMLQEVKNLKIRIPQPLKEIYEYVKSNS